MQRKKTVGLAVTILVLVLLLGGTLVVLNQPATGVKATDYSNASNWMLAPKTVNRSVDVFYIYPTTDWQTNPNATGPEICSVDNSSMRAGAQSAYARQASAFAPLANIFAPYYRQMDMWPDNRDQIIAGIPTTDCTAAFDYYIKNFNDGRPYILASHSQGSTVMTNILSGYLKDNPTVYARMIVAYVIGYTVNTTYLNNNPHLKFATGANDTGVIVSYNTETPNVTTGSNPVHSPDTITINPLSWSRSEDHVPASVGHGSLMVNLTTMTLEMVPQYADAQINNSRGSLITTAVVTGFPMPIAPGVLHSFDYMFYYYDLQYNAADRIHSYYEGHQKYPPVPQALSV
jgi:hypothetical protein